MIICVKNVICAAKLTSPAKSSDSLAGNPRIYSVMGYQAGLVSLSGKKIPGFKL